MNVAARPLYALGLCDGIGALGLGLRLALWDLIVHHTGSGPGGHNIYEPLRARRHHSYLLVFKVDHPKAGVEAEPDPQLTIHDIEELARG